MKELAATVRISLMAGIAVLTLSGCVGGTTYGTGVTQEKQTIDDLYNMFNLRKQRTQIDYTPRPDLVVPADKNALPDPLDAQATAANGEWPETPEERIARIREAAGEIDPRSGEISVSERFRKKEGIALEKGYTTVEVREGRSLSPDELRRNQREEVLKRKAELGISQGATRRYLTEPPVEYRVPAATAASGDQAYTPEELLAREIAARDAAQKRKQEVLR